MGDKQVCIREVFIAQKAATGSQSPLPSSSSIKAAAGGSHHRLIRFPQAAICMPGAARTQSIPRAGNKLPLPPALALHAPGARNPRRRA